jgi:superfamily II DNA/RNA helicase
MPLPGAAAAAAAAAAPRKQHADSRTSSTTMSQITSEKFDALDIHPQLKKGIKEAMGYEMMTKVQAAAIPGTLCDLTL